MQNESAIHRSYVALMLLLALTVGLSFVATGEWSAPVALLIAAVKAAIVLTVFMKLRESSTSMRLMALGAMLWLIFLMGLTAADYLTRLSIGIHGK